MGHSSVTLAFRILAAVAICVAAARAQQPGGGGPQGSSGPVYQRRAFEGGQGSGQWRGPDRRKWRGDGKKHGDWPHKGGQHFRPRQSPSVQSGWFQRPYPYHLDFYKMKYGGSYAPYFGNLYGPPQVVTAPPYYGPYYGDWGFGGNGQFGGYGSAPFAQPGGPGEVVYDGPVVDSAPSSQPAEQSNGDSLPAPAQQ